MLTIYFLHIMDNQGIKDAIFLTVEEAMCQLRGITGRELRKIKNLDEIFVYITNTWFPYAKITKYVLHTDDPIKKFALQVLSDDPVALDAVKDIMRS